MQLETLFLAFALMLIFEGMLPFISPKAWREIFSKVLTLEEKQIRVMGLLMMIIGLVFLLVFSA